MNRKFYYMLGGLLSSFLAILFIAQNCGRVEDASLSDFEDNEGQVVELAFAAPIHRDVQSMYDAIRNRKPIRYSVLKIVPRILDRVRFSGPINFKLPNQGSIKAGTRQPGEVKYDRFAALEFGGTVFIFKGSYRFAKQLPGSKYNRKDESQRLYEIFDTVPSTYLENKSLNARARSFIDARYYERDRIKRTMQALDGFEFLIRMFPGVDGVDRALHADTGTEKFLGAVTAVGDVASFGLGSKIQAVRKTAGAVVLTSASIRLSVAAKKAASGQANLSTGIDASLALVESALVGVTFIKIRIPKTGRIRVDSPEAARNLARVTGELEEDILRAGISREALEKLGVNIKGIAKSTLKQFDSVFSAKDISFLEDALRRSDFSDPRMKKLFDTIATRRGKPVSDVEKPITVLFEITAQKIAARTGKPYGEALSEVFRFNVAFAGNNTAKVLRIPKAGSDKPVAIHRIIGDIVGTLSPNQYPRSTEAVKRFLAQSGYTDLNKYDETIRNIAFYLNDVLPNASAPVVKLYSVQGLSQRVENVQQAVAQYLKKGTVSTGVDPADTVSFLNYSQPSHALLIEFVPSPSAAARITPVSGYGDLARVTDGLQSARGYSGAVDGEILLVPGNNPNFRIIGQPRTSVEAGVEVTRVQVQMQ